MSRRMLALCLVSGLWSFHIIAAERPQTANEALQKIANAYHTTVEHQPSDPLFNQAWAGFVETNLRLLGFKIVPTREVEKEG